MGSYILKEEIGRGAMARVWRAWDTNLEREVAIKEPLLDDSLLESTRRELSKRFVYEAKAAARLNHPNIVAIHTSGVFDGRPAIVMELIKGQTLADVLERGPLKPDSAISVLDQLLDGIGYAHSKGVIHRDLKPDNIFITKDGSVKIGDFGIAHLEGSDRSTATSVGSVLGTPGYMSPEQARGVSVDARSDLFAIGTIGYEMVTGNNPFGAADSTTMLYRIVHEDPTNFPDRETVPKGMRDAIMAALQKEPDYRPQSATEMKTLLHEGVLPNTPSLPISLKRELPEWAPYVAVVCIGLLFFLILMMSSGSNGGGGGAAIAPASSTSSQQSESSAVFVPDIVNKSISEANALLTSEGLYGYKAGEEYSSTVRTGAILSQDPASGTQMQSGSSVGYIVSLGPETTEATRSTAKTGQNGASQGRYGVIGASANGVYTYTNHNYGYSLKLPDSCVLESESATQEGEEAFFQNRDASIMVESFIETNGGKTLDEVLDSYTSDFTLDYSQVENESFYIQYKQEDYIYLVRAYVANGNQAAVIIAYKESAKDQFSSTAEDIAASFNPGKMFA